MLIVLQDLAVPQELAGLVKYRMVLLSLWSGAKMPINQVLVSFLSVTEVLVLST